MLHAAVCVQSVVMVLFRERHSFDEEQTAWELWHMRQHSFKQRVIDVGQLFRRSLIAVLIIRYSCCVECCFHISSVYFFRFISTPLHARLNTVLVLLIVFYILHF